MENVEKYISIKKYIVYYFSSTQVFLIFLNGNR